MRRKLLSILALLCLTVSGAWALTPLTGDTWDDGTKTLTVNSNPGTSAYKDQTEIVNLVISSSVTSIGTTAFRGCTSLTTVDFAEVSTLETIGNSAFMGCSGLTSITIPNSVKSIGQSAFRDCTSLTTITIPNSVTSLGNQAFNGCSGLTKVTIGSGVSSIGQNVFNGCSSLTTITIPSGVTSIGNTAFRDCTNLTTVTVLGASCTLGNNAFYNCSNLTYIFVPSANVATYEAATNWSAYTTQIQEAPATYDVTAKSAGGAYWSTFYTAAGDYQADANTQVFAVNLTGTGITMTEITDRIAKIGEGVVLKNSTAGSITMTKTETAPAGDFSGNSLKGTMTIITNPSNAYVLNYKAATGAGFYKLSASGTIGANKAYLTYSGGAGAPSFLGFGDVTAIEGIVKSQESTANGQYFDLQGRRVLNPTKGLYIVNGKKVVIK